MHNNDQNHPSRYSIFIGIVILLGARILVATGLGEPITYIVKNGAIFAMLSALTVPGGYKC